MSKKEKVNKDNMGDLVAKSYQEDPWYTKEMCFSAREKLSSDVPLAIHTQIAYALQFGIDKFTGDMLTLIETLGLSEKQEKAIKDQMRRVFNDRYNSTVDGLHMIGPILDDVINPQSGRTWTVLGGRQNALITGCGYLPGEIRED